MADKSDSIYNIADKSDSIYNTADKASVEGRFM